MSDHDPYTTERPLAAQRLGQYVTRNRCERYLRLALFPSETASLLKRYDETTETLSLLLSESGQRFERDRVAELKTTERVIDLQNKSSEDFISEVKAQPVGRTYYDQPVLEGRIGEWCSTGRADLIEITRAKDGSISALIIDIKASRRETVGFRLQVAFYARLVADSLKRAGLTITSLRGAIASRDVEFGADKFKPFPLDLYMDEIERLVAAPNSDVARAVGRTFETASYQLGPHCDGCPYNALCFIDTAEREDLSLVPMLSASEKNSLKSEGITRARDLAVLMNYARGAMEIAPGEQSRVEAVSRRWPLGSRLPILAQRARAALRRYDREIEYRNYLLGADYGSLPEDALYPDLIKIFVDAGRDHIEDRMYMIAGLVAGPAGTAEVVEMTERRPDTERERELLIKWFQRLLPAIARVSDTVSAPAHVYLYDRRGQRALLEALARHFDALCAIPAFYDLLTSSPALTQGMVSFLAEEVNSRMNLSSICQNLYQAARELGFKWSDDSREFSRGFRTRIFDNSKQLYRDNKSRQFEHAPRPGADPVWVEAAARFGTEIPLEYAYAAWGLLEETEDLKQKARAHLRSFLKIKTDDIIALAAHRCRALRHIEKNFKYKNRRVEKHPLDLSNLDRVEADPEDVPFHRSLEDFLYLEHHAVFQERMLHFSLPPELRAQTGRTAVIRCDECRKLDGGALIARFGFADTSGARVTIKELATIRFREGDWVVLNPLTDEAGKPIAPTSILKGRISVIDEINDAGLSLRLLSMNFKKSAFRYPHRIFTPEPGKLFTIDEMADDLNSDKFLAACRNASSNHLYRWLSDREAGRQPRQIRPSRLRAATEIADLAARSQSPHGLTPAQRRVIGEHFADRVLVVQGPPGTGKSHTLGFAVLARALALSTPARPFRVAVAARTHSATSIALESIARRAGDLLKAFPDDARIAMLDKMKLGKICNAAGEPVPEGVERVFADGSESLSPAEQWEALLAEPILVIGGTPGGLYNLVKRASSRKRVIDWTEEHFDLVVIDEASQMGIAEALTATAFLREDGQFIAIGDHRQMPPILAHAWDQDSRRELQHSRPHLSIFEYLRELGFTSAALDQSFRIPAEIAGFLDRHIYSQDKINFRSDNRRRIAGSEALAGWLRAALAPAHSLVVVEHDEAGSQQANQFEAALIERIARAGLNHLGLNAVEGIGIVVPHRAQKALLRERLPELADSIDTVERFQGGERDLVIVSATVSDREFAKIESGFLLDPRRLTVAISRPKRKLIVISSSAVFDLIPGDLDEYERAALWKYLRHECNGPSLWEGEVEGHRLCVRAINS